MRIHTTVTIAKHYEIAEKQHFVHVPVLLDAKKNRVSEQEWVRFGTGSRHETNTIVLESAE